jgi:hypothetical protein
MSQAPITIPDGTGAEVLQRLRDAFGAVASIFSGATAPDLPVRFWHDTINGLLKYRDIVDDTKWNILFDLKTGANFFKLNSMSELKAIPVPVDGVNVIVSGYYSAGDGGGGQFYWDAASTESDNGGTIIVPTSNPAVGRWKRICNDEFYPEWFGAKGEDSTFDDAPAIRAAITAAGGSKGAVVLSRKYYLTSTHPTNNTTHLFIDGVTRIKIKGTSRGAILCSTTLNKHILLINNGSEQVSVEEFYLDRTATSGVIASGIVFADGATSIPYFDATNIMIYHQYIGLACMGRPMISKWVNCEFAENAMHGAHLEMNNDEFFTNCRFSDNGGFGLVVGDSTTKPSDGAVYLTGCIVYGNQFGGVKLAGNTEEQIYNIFISNSIIDNNNGYGILGSYVRNFMISGTRVSWNTDHGVRLTRCGEVRMSSIDITDNKRCGLWNDGGNNITGSSVGTMSNGREGDYANLRIDDGAQFVSISALTVGNADNVENNQGQTVERQTSLSGIHVVKGANGVSPQDTFLSCVIFKNVATKFYFESGVANTNHLVYIDGATYAHYAPA